MEEFLGTDMRIEGADWRLAPSGDVALCVGRHCLIQDLMIRLGTPRGDLWSDPDFGVDLHRFVHVPDTALARIDLVQMVAEEMEKDPRVVAGSAEAEVERWDRGTLRLRASCEPVDGSGPLNLVLGYDLTEISLEAVVGLGA